MTSAGRNVRTLGVILAVAGLLGLLFSVVMPQLARAASAQRIEIDLGTGFTTDPHGTVLDTSRLAPGLTASGIFGVRSDFAGTSDLQVKFVDVTARNGCARAQLAGGQTCDQGGGRLEDELVFGVAVGDSRNGPFTSTWSGGAADLESGVTLPSEVQGPHPRWVRLSVTLPDSSGNETQNDRFGFGLEVTLTSSFGTDALTISRDPSAIDRIGLAATGVSIALLVAAAGALIVSGVLMMGGRRRREIP